MIVEIPVALPHNFLFNLDNCTAVLPRCNLKPGTEQVWPFDGTKDIPCLFQVHANQNCYVITTDLELTTFATGLFVVVPSWRYTTNHAKHFASDLVYKNRDFAIHHAPNRISTLSLPGIDPELEDRLTQI
jgi:hypothetical protein